MGLLDKMSPQMDPARRRSLIASYSLDWAITIVLFLIFALIDKAPGFQRQFSVTDESIQHTFAVKERVPFYAAVIAAAIFPAIVIILTGAIARRSFYDVHSGILGLVLALALTTTLTDIVKITVGRPRPDFLDRCQLIVGTVNQLPYGLTTVASCTQTNSRILNDGFKSFFSGHSSFSFCGLGFLAFYLAGKLHLFSDQKGYAFKAWIAFSPFVIAGLIAISRTMDYRHHATDVLIGGIVGTLIAYFTYRMYYPSLGSINSHLPYSPRIPALVAKITDLESIEIDATISDAELSTSPRLIKGGRGGAKYIPVEDESEVFERLPKDSGTGGAPQRG